MIQATQITAALRQALPRHAQGAFEDAIDGRDFSGCVFTAPNEFRGHIAYLFYLRCRLGECSVEDYRAILDKVWSHDYRWVRMAARTRRTLKAMFQTGDCPLPDGLPDQVQIWRGLARDTKPWRRGISWTTHQPTACWFAMRNADLSKARPAVLTVTVPRTALLHWCDERQEKEVICFDTDEAVVDGTPEDWMESHRTLCTERKVADEARMAAWMVGRAA